MSTMATSVGRAATRRRRARIPCRGAGNRAAHRRRVVKRRAAAAVYDAAALAGHSQRAGFITEAGRRGLALPAVMELSGHKPPAVAAAYHRSGAVLGREAARLAAKPAPPSARTWAR